MSFRAASRAASRAAPHAAARAAPHPMLHDAARASFRAVINSLFDISPRNHFRLASIALTLLGSGLSILLRA